MIKAAVIAKIQTKVNSDGAVLINEMVFSHGARRADLAVVNGNLHAFEIKSDLDTLRRLEGQVSDYSSRFDKLILVVSEKFVEHALQSNEKIGVWKASLDLNGKVRLQVIRPGRLDRVRDVGFLCDFLLKSELIDLVRAHKKYTYLSRLSRENLTALALDIPISIIRDFMLRAIKLRYEKTSSLFFATCSDGVVSPNEMDNLSRSKVRRKEMEELFKCPRALGANVERREINLSRFFPKGDIPENIPRFVLVPS
ncbi:hypothetical protein SAMN03159342_01190 [Pseudomonas sp. NFPP04]|nr:hypothetical protein SAMN03159512_01229 [Pseudomonas sp. NFR09]SFH95956.1 hypothetical protein SAMN03159342_01190 [Pseudomonas sp. NFPP04]SFJ04431.1 hypothetical protein SAMN03159344_02492 [Pseudomonas sp. NFPP11]